MRRHVYYYTHLECPEDVAYAAFASDASHWLPAPCIADSLGWRVDLQAQGALAPDGASLPAVVTVGPVATSASGLLRALAWRPNARGGRLPVLEGDLELVALGGGGCHLSLMGTYRPTLQVADPNGSRRGEHRVAEACVRRFVLDVAQRLEAARLPACTSPQTASPRSSRPLER